MDMREILPLSYKEKDGLLLLDGDCGANHRSHFGGLTASVTVVLSCSFFRLFWAHFMTVDVLIV